MLVAFVKIHNCRSEKIKNTVCFKKKKDGDFQNFVKLNYNNDIQKWIPMLEKDVLAQEGREAEINYCYRISRLNLPFLL